MGLYDAYDPTRRAVLEPADVWDPIPGFPETVVMTFQPSLMERIAAAGAPKLAQLSAFFKLPIYSIRYGGKELAIFQTLLGGSATASLVEEAAAMGGKKFVLFGSCGSLDAQHPDSTLIVPTAAYRDEGVSYHYLPAGQDYLPLPTAERTAALLDRLGLPHVTARTWTTDALYRETRRNLERRRAEGCLCVDMECASVAAVCAFRGLEFYTFFYTEDNLGGDAWDPRLMGKLPQDAKEAYLKIALELAAHIA